MKTVKSICLAIGLVFATLGLIAATLHPIVKVGDTVPGGTLLPTGQIATDQEPTRLLKGRPVDLVVASDGTQYVKLTDAIVRHGGGKPDARVSLSGASLHGLALSADGLSLYATDASNGLHIVATASMLETGTIKFPNAKVGGSAYPCGVALSADGVTAWVCLSRSNTLAEVDLPTKTIVRQIPVEPAPYDVAVAGNQAVVSCWGRTAHGSMDSADASGTRVAVDSRGAATGGAVCFVELKTRKVESVEVPRQPSQILTLDNKTAYVPCAADDRLIRLDLAAHKLTGNLTIRLRDTSRPGAAPNALSTNADHNQLYVACGGLNAIAVINVAGPSAKINGFVPAGWYPIAVQTDGNSLIVANAKGVGSRSDDGPKKGVYDFLGSINQINLPSINIGQGTSLVARNTRTDDTFANPQPGFAGQAPIPTGPNEHSPIKHVFYILKENRTYDQVLGDMKQGNGDPSLVLYGRKITPNHHALAEEFVLLDNYYCNGVLSADGHAWAMEGNASSYFERSFGGWTRSYPFGDDPIAVSGTGYLWNNVLAHGKTFRNYGEFDYSTPIPPEHSYTQIYRDYQVKKPFAFKSNIGVASLRPYSNHSSPGWNLNIPDVVRAREFIRDFQNRDRAGTVADLSIIYLPQDHTSGLATGSPKPQSHIADNDLALGQIIEAISNSKVWGSSTIFVNEDDPQDGFDHVDGHRSPCFVVSPYARRGAVISEFYNQTSVLHTMESILGVPPMNLMDQNSPLMTACFQNTPDLTRYVVKKNQVPLAALNPKPVALSGSQRHWAAISNLMNLSRPDLVNDREMNHALWAAAHPHATYPSRFRDGD